MRRASSRKPLIEVLGDRTLLSTIHILDFNQDGVLPSSEGWTYAGDIPETSAFSVSDGLLHLDSFYPGGSAATYIAPPASYDVTLDLFVETRVKVQDLGPNPGFALFAMNDRVGPATGALVVGVDASSIWFFSSNGVTEVPFDPLDDAFHSYRLEATGSTRQFSFFVDGALTKTGTIGGAFFGPGDTFSLYFGDGGGGPSDNIRADIDFFHYLNGVPEPSTLALLGTGVLGLGASYLLRRKQAADGRRSVSTAVAPTGVSQQ